ncbi:SDR family NAD(P)-dependent oxidoreductase [Xanthomonas campestris]|uniref:SDR family NAD(P)-dependent oxidoreductase n=1 Tax=Xanthomonas campestris TaxID=339 RepID=UPI0023E93FB5|nr:NAD(P)-dependent dehydrogenase (short-subunit alcohol dehydrogenase family) [Xanthomonas campestris]
MSSRPIILITGATNGIGLLAAIELARRGADLILTARTAVKADAARSAILAAAPRTKIDIYDVDFGDLASVAACGAVIAQRHPRIDVMVNNAGVHAFKPRVTKDGFTEMIAVNYFAPWLLTDTLRETIVRSAPSRIVNVGSEASRQSGGVDIDRDLTDIAGFSARGSSKIYGRSKLLDIMFSLELAEQLANARVTVNCLCPGFNVTGLGRELGAFSAVLSKVLNLFGIGDPARGAGMIVKLATDPAFALRTGAYVKGDRDITPLPPADSMEARHHLWAKTKRLLSPFLP